MSKRWDEAKTAVMERSPKLHGVHCSCGWSTTATCRECGKAALENHKATEHPGRMQS